MRPLLAITNEDMGRKPFSRNLRALSGSSELHPTDRKAEALAGILRRAALTHQTAQPRIFYALRDVAARFNVPLSLVSAVYRQLEGEGLLTPLRGSRTVLNAKESTRNIRVRRIVGIPMALSTFLTRRKARLFFVEARRELQRRGFATVGVFYEDREARPDILATRISESKADSVLWYMPDHSAREASHVLSDRGIRVVAVCDGGPAPSWCRYEVRRDNALAVVLKHWHRCSGLRRARILRMARRSAADEGRIAAVAEAEGFEQEILILTENAVPSHLANKREARDHSYGYILTGAAASFLGYREPQYFGELTAVHRAALFDGPITLPFTSMPTARADIIVVNWQKFAKELTKDLMTEAAFKFQWPKQIEPEVHLQANLGDFADLIS